MKIIKIADLSDLNAIVQLRDEQQIEDWSKTSNGKDYSIFADEFEIITKNYICKRLNKTLYFALMYIEETTVSMCALEIVDNLPPRLPYAKILWVKVRNLSAFLQLQNIEERDICKYFWITSLILR